MQYPKISTRRYGRLLTFFILKTQKKFDKLEDNIPHYYLEFLKDYLDEDLLNNPILQKQICSFSIQLINGISTNKDNLITSINAASKNRSWNKFVLLDQLLLLIGTYEFANNSSDAKIIIKEILIIGDLLHNEHAAPYISGILKTMAYGNNTQLNYKGKKTKIRLKSK